MDITEIRVFLADEDRLKAYVTVTFENCFVVRDLKVINGNGGLFVAMPSKKKKDGSYKDVAHPINADFRNYLEEQILEKYRDELKMVEAGFPIRKRDDDDFETIDSDTPSSGSGANVVFENRHDYEAGVGPGLKK